MALLEDVFGVRGQGKLQPDEDITGSGVKFLTYFFSLFLGRVRVLGLTLSPKP
jgi:hypothetical protein